MESGHDGPAPGVYVRQVGVGPPLVLVHGLLVSGAMFDPLVPAWSARYRLVVPDLRGHGRSAGMPGPYGIGKLVADLVDLLDRLNLPRAHVLGYSQGGAVAQQLAHDHPDRVDRLVLACTFGYNRHSARERAEGVVSSFLLATLGPAAIAGLAARGGGGPALSDGQAAELRRMLAVGDRRRAVAAHRALLDFDSRGWLAEIVAPTLVICGSADRAVPPWHAELLADGIPHATLHTIPGGGHFLVWTHTAQLVEIVDGWLSAPPD